jgi:hypothetical protein
MDYHGEGLILVGSQNSIQGEINDFRPDAISLHYVTRATVRGDRPGGNLLQPECQCVDFTRHFDFDYGQPF